MKARFVSEAIDFQRGGDEKDIIRRIIGDRPGKIVRPNFQRRSFEVFILARDGKYVEIGFFMTSPGSHKKGGGLKTFYFKPDPEKEYAYEEEDLIPLSKWEQNKMTEFLPEISKAFGVGAYFGEKKVNENINFERGKDPLKTMGIGLEPAIRVWMEKAFAYATTPMGSWEHNYTLHDDGTISLHQDLDIPSSDLSPGFPPYIKFRRVEGAIHLDNCGLEYLSGLPEECVEFFSCEGNKLTSLEGAPKRVIMDFFCRDNPGEFTVKDVKAVSLVDGKIYSEDNLKNE